MRLRPGKAGKRPTGARLFLVYAFASLVPVVGLGAVLAHAAQQSGTDRGLAQGRAQAAVISQMVVAPSLDGGSLGRGLTSAEVTKLQRATDLAIYSGSVSSLRLRSFSGQVVFSDNGSSAGAVPVTDPAFKAAARGGTDISVTGDGSARSIRVVEPIVPNTTGESTGVLEIELPYGPIAAAVRAETHRTYELLAGGLAVVYLVLAAIAWSTTRKLSRHAARQTYHARHDHLTGLPNRAAFRDFAGTALADTQRGGAIVLVDLNRFKEVNDVLGHHAGDELLKCAASRLVESLRTDDHVGRLGGDEFGIILPGATDRTQIMALLAGVHDALGQDTEIAGTVLHIEASLGVAIFPEHGNDIDELLRDADAAMYQSKRGRRPTTIFDEGAATDAALTDAEANEIRSMEAMTS